MHSTLIAVTFSLLFIVGCETRQETSDTPRADGVSSVQRDGPAERVGEAVDDVIVGAGSAVERLGENMQDARGERPRAADEPAEPRTP